MGEQMTCPFCNSEMMKGKLLGNQLALSYIEMKWTPDGAGVPITGLTNFDNEIILKDSSGFFGRSYTKSFVCAECRKLIVDL